MPTEEQRRINDMNTVLEVLARQYAGALEYAEDFERAWRDTMRDAQGRAALTVAYQQAQVYGRDHGGRQCCGTVDDWHNPWCETGPRRHRARDGEPGVIRVEVTSEADVTRMVAAFTSLPVLMNSDYEILLAIGAGPAIRRAWRKDGQRGATNPTDWATMAVPMERRRAACRGGVYGTDKSGAVHGPHEFFAHRYAEAIPCPGWTDRESGATVLADRLDQVGRDAVWPMRLPAGIRLECHPSVPGALRDLFIPGPEEFVSSLSTGEDVLKPQIPVVVMAGMGRGEWRLVADDGLIAEGVVRDG